MKLKNKKSQVTIFIIIGIVILVIVGLVYSTTRSTEKAAVRTEMRKVEETKFETQPIKIFVEDCLDGITKDGLELIGKQGGRLSADQGGTLPPPIENIDDVSYAIKRSPSDYEVGLYGRGTLPALMGGGVPPEVPNSIQHQLESYIASKLPECNLSTFENRFIIRPGAPTIDVSIAKDNVDVKLDYPLEVESEATGAKTTVRDFSKSQKVRLGHIYDFAAELVTSDTIDLTFDIENPPSLQGLDARIKREVAGTKDDIINITDPRSLLKGKPYLFRFARENRMPKVDDITTIRDPIAFNVVVDGGASNDRIYPQNITAPTAKDPDEDQPIIVNFNIKYPESTVHLDEEILAGGTQIETCPAVVEVCASDEAEVYCRDVTDPVTGETYRIECS